MFLFKEPTVFSIDLFCFLQSLFYSFPLLSLWFLLTFVVPSLSHVWLSAAPWTAICQASLFFTISWNLLKILTLVFVSSYILVPLDIRLDDLFENFLLSWSRLFILFWLCCIFIAALAFSLVAVRRGYSLVWPCGLSSCSAPA